MSRGSSTQFDSLHGLVARLLTEELHRAAHAKECAECGQRPGISPALLEKAIKFLKDNGIDSPVREGGRIDTLKKAMPDFDELERANVVPLQRP
jgi:hypothetical protein